PVAAHHQQARRLRPCRNGAREIGQHQALGAIGDAGERERPAAEKQFGRRLRHWFHVGSPAAKWKARRRRNRSVSSESESATGSTTSENSSGSGMSISHSKSSSSRSLIRSIQASAKRPMIRSISRLPRCQARNNSRRRRGSSPSEDLLLPVIASTPKARTCRAPRYSQPNRRRVGRPAGASARER